MYFAILAFPSMALSGTVIPDGADQNPVYASNFFVDDLLPQINLVKQQYAIDKVVFIGPEVYTKKFGKMIDESRLELPVEYTHLSN